MFKTCYQLILQNFRLQKCIEQLRKNIVSNKLTEATLLQDIVVQQEAVDVLKSQVDVIQTSISSASESLLRSNKRLQEALEETTPEALAQIKQKSRTSLKSLREQYEKLPQIKVVTKVVHHYHDSSDDYGFRR